MVIMMMTAVRCYEKHFKWMSYQNASQFVQVVRLILETFQYATIQKYGVH